MELECGKTYVYGIWHHITNEYMVVFQKKPPVLSVIINKDYYEATRFEYPLTGLKCTDLELTMNDGLLEKIRECVK